MMLEELFHAICSKAVAANHPKITKVDCEPDHVYYLNEVRKEAAPPVRNHFAYSLDTIKEWVTAHEEGSTVWHSRDAVVVLADRDSIVDRGRVTMELADSDQMTAIRNLEEEEKPLTQKEFILLLRTTFFGCWNGNILDLLRSVRWKIGEAGESTVKHQSRNIGKTLEAEITGLDAIPEYLTLDVPVFGQGSLRAVREKIKLAIDPDPASQTFRLIPLPGEIENAYTSAEEKIREDLSTLKVPIYYGNP